jgi:AbrB family looped-hinge helix DNA binding protein
MEISLTKMSPNGQIVIPACVRKVAGLDANSQFLVFNQDGNILLKLVSKESLQKDMELIERIQLSETQVQYGKVTKTNSNMSDREIDDLLMK